jgi:hypothetical protein
MSNIHRNHQVIELLMVSTSYPENLEDWRGLFIRHLADALARRDDLAVRLWSPPGEVHPRIQLDLGTQERRWLTWLMQQGGIAHLLRSHNPQRLIAPLRLLYYLHQAYKRNSDVAVYHINWLQNALALPSNGRPALITALGSDMKFLKLPLMRQALRRKFKSRRVAICPNAEWMVDPLDTAFGDIARIEYVPFGIDPCWYQIARPEPPPTKPALWLAVTRITRAKIGTLFDWGEPWFRNNARELHLFGPLQEALDIPDWVTYHGPISPADLHTQWFPRATGLITLSQHAEGRPQVMLEAMASGLPIVASRGISAHEDLLQDRVTGRLCDASNTLGHALEELESWPFSRELGERARTWVRDAVGTWDDCAARYLHRYEYLLDGTHP